MEFFIQAVYILTVFFFILGLRRMSHPKTARSGVVWAGVAMLAAVLVTFLTPGFSNWWLMLIALALGGTVAYLAAKRVAMTDMPQMVAIYNGMGGGAAGAIAAVELLRGPGGVGLAALSVAGALIGAISFTGSIIAFLKLQGWMRQRPITFPAQQLVNGLFFLVTLSLGVVMLFTQPAWVVIAFFTLMLIFGVMMTLPIGGADMPVVISLYNAMTGIAVAFDGFALPNAAMIVAGTVVGAAGTLLTLMMARAMNRSLGSVLFGAFGAVEQDGEVEGSLKPIEADDVAAMMAYAGKVVVAPGYGLAVAQAQHKVKELMEQLEAKGVTVKFAIHPVAGRMPGHMNVLLAEAGVPYDRLVDMEDINPEFESTDVVLVIGANDVVNPAAHRKGSPLYGMPILEVEHAHNVIVMKRGQGKGFAGVENELFYGDNAHMLYGDARESVGKLVQALKRF